MNRDRATGRSCARRALLVVACLAVTGCATGTATEADGLGVGFDPGTEADRIELFDFLVESTLAWDAFASLPEHPYYGAHPAGIDVRAGMERYRDEMRAADSAEKLWYVLWKLSNVRMDRHLQVTTVPGGLVLPDSLLIEAEAPIRFETDFGDAADRFFFVADVGTSIARQARGAAPQPGDRLIEVNRRSAAEYVAAMRPYQRYSTEYGFWWNLADEIHRTRPYVPPREFYGEALDLVLERRDGTRYRTTLPYLATSDIEWEGHGARRYPGFERVAVLSSETFDLYLPQDDALSVVLLQWHGFRPDLPEAMDRLIAFADARGLLDHDVIVDATYSRGGSRGAYAVQRLQARPFRTTFGNLKVSEAMERWVDEQVRSLRADPAAARETVDGGSWLLDWLETDVRRAIDERRRYTNSVPFKGAHLPKWADGIIDPAPLHFRGALTVWLSGRGGSHLDQFAAQIVDNALGHVVGMPAGGFSNTWQTTEVLRFPGSGRPIVNYQWSLGHSLRPNGEILQYNPAAVHEHVPQTRDNYFDYHARLLRSTLARLDTDAPRAVEAAAGTLR
jgi:hypothetical protein